jgi:vesicle coat complex subunit
MMGPEGFGSDTIHDAASTPSEGYPASGSRRSEWPFNRQNALELGKDAEKLRALRQILAEVSQGDDASQYFPSVVKLVGHSDLEVRPIRCVDPEPRQSF